MALTDSDKREIERITRKEIKDFFNSSTLKQHEEKMVDLIKKEIKNGKIKENITEIIAKAFTEFYYTLWSRKSQWESDIKNLR